MRPFGDIDTLEDCRDFIEELPDFVLISDIAGFLLYANRAAREAVGRSPSGISGLQITDFIAPADRAAFRDALANAERGTCPAAVRVRFLQGDGQLLVIEGRITARRRTDGTAVLRGIFRDMTAWARRESELRQLALITERTDICVILTDPDARTIWVNDGFTRKTGYTLDEMLGRTPGSMLQGPSTDPAEVERIRESIRQRKPVVSELVNYRKDGASYIASLEIRPVFDDSGSLTHFMSVQRDVTDLRQVEQRLREQAEVLERRVDERTAELQRSQRQFEALIEFAPDAFILVDGQGTIQMVNQRAEMLFGWPREELVGQSMEVLVPNRYRPQHTVLAAGFLKDGGTRLPGHRPSVTCLRRDGGTFPAEIGLARLESAEGTRVAAVVRDIQRRLEIEEELKRSNELLTEVTETIDEAFWLFDNRQGRVAYISPGFERIWGRSVTELYADLRTYLEGIHPADRPAQFAALERQGRGERTELEYRVIRPDGTIRWVLDRAFPKFDESGQVLRTAGVALDITEHVWNRCRLNLQNEVLKVLTSDRPLAEVLDVLCRRVEIFDETHACAVVQHGVDGSLRVLAGPSLTFELRRQLEVRWDASKRPDTSNARAYAEPEGVFDLLGAVRSGSGTPPETAQPAGAPTSWALPIVDDVATRGYFVILRPTGRFPNENERRLLEEGARLASIAMDRNRVQRALAESEAHFRALADSGIALIWAADTDGKCVYFNQPWLRFTGRTLEQQTGDGWVAGVHPDDLSNCFRQYRESVGGRDSFMLRYRLRRHDGVYRWIEDYGTPRYDSQGTFIGYIGHCLDITDRLEAERRLQRSQRLEAIGQLAGGIAHDLNNALAPILMTVTYLRMEHPDSADLVETMEASARRCADMVKQLVTFARGAEGDRRLLEPCQLIRELERIIQGTFPKNIELRVQGGNGLSTVLGDATQLHQVLLNLCVNSRDAMPSGGRLTIRAENVEVAAALSSTIPEAHEGRYVLFEVADTGTGIPPEIQDRIFEPFFTTKGPNQGTGLGLSTVMGLVKGHGGFLRLESVPGAGSRFQVYIPAAKPASTDGGSGAICPTPRFPGDGITVLVVDDEPNVRTAFATVLGSLGFKVLLAADGTEALVAVTKKRDEIRLIVTDLHMPQMDGLQFARTLVRLGSKIPIILASGRVEPREEREFRSLGNCVLLPKPFTQETLMKALREALPESAGSGPTSVGSPSNIR